MNIMIICIDLLVHMITFGYLGTRLLRRNKYKRARMDRPTTNGIPMSTTLQINQIRMI